jgi:hypothetical protein
MSTPSLYVDLHIENNDLKLDAGGEPTLLDNRARIAQDIKHLIRESGLLVEVLGERDPAQVAVNVLRLEQMIDEDVRLVPGTVTIERQGVGLFFVTAETVDFGPIGFEAVLIG